MESPSEDTLLPKRSQRQHHNTILTPLLPPLPVFKTKTASSILFPAFFHEEYDLPLRQEHDLPCSQKINRPERCIDVRQACVRKIRHPIPAGAVLIPVLRPRSSVHRQKQTHSVLGCPAPSPSPSPSPSPLSETCIRGGTHGKHCHNIVIEDEMMHTNQTLRPQFPDPKTLTNPSVSHALPPKVTPHNPIPPTSHLHRSIQHRQPPPTNGRSGLSPCTIQYPIGTLAAFTPLSLIHLNSLSPMKVWRWVKRPEEAEAPSPEASCHSPRS